MLPFLVPLGEPSSARGKTFRLQSFLMRKQVNTFTASLVHSVAEVRVVLELDGCCPSACWWVGLHLLVEVSTFGSRALFTASLTHSRYCSVTSGNLAALKVPCHDVDRLG
jgi:hypothetical protein